MSNVSLFYEEILLILSFSPSKYKKNAPVKNERAIHVGINPQSLSNFSIMVIFMTVINTSVAFFKSSKEG